MFDEDFAKYKSVSTDSKKFYRNYAKVEKNKSLAEDEEKNGKLFVTKNIFNNTILTQTEREIKKTDFSKGSILQTDSYLARIKDLAQRRLFNYSIEENEDVSSKKSTPQLKVKVSKARKNKTYAVKKRHSSSIEVEKTKKTVVFPSLSTVETGENQRRRSFRRKSTIQLRPKYLKKHSIGPHLSTSNLKSQKNNVLSSINMTKQDFKAAPKQALTEIYKTRDKLSYDEMHHLVSIYGSSTNKYRKNILRNVSQEELSKGELIRLIDTYMAKTKINDQVDTVLSKKEEEMCSSN